MTDADATSRAVPPTQPAGQALLHLLCDVPPDLEATLTDWWERFHHPELLTLPGFLSARRGRLDAPHGPGRILTLYRLADPAAADQPRGEDFTLMPDALNGRVSFVRRVLRRATPAAANAEPVGEAILQLLRVPSDPDPASLQRVADELCSWPGVLSVSSWRTGRDHTEHDRSEVVQLGDTDLVLAELRGQAPASELLARAKASLPGWSAHCYGQAYPAAGVLVAQLS
jgi:hypothetical protein